jgi:putative ABC transport system permease protein
MPQFSRSDWRDTAMGDLAEERLALARRRSRLVAFAWYWFQVALLHLDALGRQLAGVWRAARTRFGDRPIRTFVQEIRVAARAIARYPLVTAAIVLTLAIGLGANAAAFSMLDALVLRPFAVKLEHVDRLALLSEWSEAAPFPRESVSAPNFLDWQNQASSFDRMALFGWWQVNLAARDESERVQGFQVSGDYFSVFNQTPALGRFIDASDTASDRRVVVLGDALWKRRFDRRPDIVGQTVLIDGEPHEIIGVAQPGFDLPFGTAWWGAWKATPRAREDRRDRSLTVVARLAPGRTLPDAQAEMAVIGDRLLKAHPRENENFFPRVQTFTQGIVDANMDQILGMIQIGALLVLVIGGANVMNLLMARGADRQREIALRLAIGASRARVIWQLLLEGVVLAAIAVPVSLGLAFVALRAFKSALPARVVPFVAGWDQIDIDGRLILVIVSAAALASIAFSVIPAWQSSRPNLVSSLREGGRSVAGRGSGRFLRGALVVGQVALAVPLLSATAVAVKLSDQVTRGPQGYDPNGVITMRTVLPEATYDDAAQRRFAEDLIDGTSRLSGVESAATTTFVPSGDSSASREIIVDGRADEGEGRRPSAAYRAVSSRYFEVMHLPILSGRAFTTEDTPDGAPVAIVSQALATKLFQDQNPIGRHVHIGGFKDERAITIVGVAGNILDDWLSSRFGPMLYVPMPQHPSGIVNLVARTSGDPAKLAGPVRETLRSVDPAQPPVHVMTMTAMVRERTTGLRMIGTMMGALGALAMVLAAIGLYSLMAYSVVQRRHEIGVRMALGASRGGIVRLTIRRAWWLTAMGAAIGLVLAVPLSGLLRNVFFGTVTPGALLYLNVILGVVVIALTAGAIPARQAARVEPISALRAE